jgi:hypothetical protein
MTTRHRRIALLTGAAPIAGVPCNAAPEFGLSFLLAGSREALLREAKKIYDEADDWPISEIPW